MHGRYASPPILGGLSTAPSATGLRFVRGERALVGSFVIDLCAMTFGMPRALFLVEARA